MEEFRYLRGTSHECVDAFEDLWLKTMRKFRPISKIALFVPCSWGKPYSQSYIHFFINRELYKLGLLHRIDRWHVSNAGIIPASAELDGISNDVGFFAYDWDSRFQTEEEEKYHVRSTSERLVMWRSFVGSKYPIKFSYLRPGSKGLRAIQATLSEVTNLAPNPNRPSDLPPQCVHDPDTVLISAINLQFLGTSIERALKGEKKWDG